jgi:hypothetical protein
MNVKYIYIVFHKTIIGLFALTGNEHLNDTSCSVLFCLSISSCSTE